MVINATYFGKTIDKLGLIVAKDVLFKEPIAYNFIVTEAKEVYRDSLGHINDKSFILNAVALDGKSRIISLLEGIPLQMCHFHMKSIITYNPKLQASIEP